MVEVVAYDPRWAEGFEGLRAVIGPAVAEIGASVEHVGSTSVVGLAAKPIIDVDVVVQRIEGVGRAVAILEGLGYRHLGDQGVPEREAFEALSGSGEAEVKHHLYVVVSGSKPHRDHVDLRDYLRGRPEREAEYARLKADLGARYLPHDRVGYTDAKGPWIARALAEARGELGTRASGSAL
ncbi:MAG: GrpB family protein [Dehalococcoidia bacterium]